MRLNSGIGFGVFCRSGFSFYFYLLERLATKFSVFPSINSPLLIYYEIIDVIMLVVNILL